MGGIEEPGGRAFEPVPRHSAWSIYEGSEAEAEIKGW
jgi:hypothetical protein